MWSGISRKAVAICGVAAMLPLAACSSDSTPTSGDGLARSAEGDLTVNGGARRVHGDQSEAIRAAIDDSTARNVILLIGDGMGDSEITLARDYIYGAGGSLPGIDAPPLTGQYTTYSLEKDGAVNYVTDSAASASSWATGTKTYNGALSVDIGDKPQRTILEIAKANGLATGNVTTAAVQDATPAALVAHITHRDCFGPVETSDLCAASALENGGPGSITEQLLTARADVTLGGGAESFAQTATAGEFEGKTLQVQAKERGYQLINTAEELAAVTEANQDAPVLGLFSEGNMPTNWTGPAATQNGYLQPAVKCTPNPERSASVPVLADMTQKAIDLLGAHDSGFFLQVEGASIDKQAHLANACKEIGETDDFDLAVQKALSFAEKDGKTLVVVIADHAHSSQIVPNFSEEEVQQIAESKQLPVESVHELIYPGLTQRLMTADDSEITVSYATSTDPTIEKETHTGTQTRIAAFGPRAANVVGLTDQTNLFFTIAEALSLDRGAQTGH